MRISKSPAELGFNRYDVHHLKKALKAVSDKRPFRRLQAVLLVAQGHLINEVSQIIEVSVQIIYHWIRSYLQNHRVESLYDAPRSGRPPAAKSITAKRLQQELGRNPLRLGYRTTVWTVALLARQLNRRYACSISPRTLYRRMRQMGLRSKRPRYVYSEKDPHRAQKKGPSSGN
jgi:transposase